MPRPKKSVKQSTIRWTEKAWKNLLGKGEISKLVNEAVEKLGESEIIIDISKCEHYRGTYPRNIELIGCGYPDGKKTRWMPKTECIACKYYKANHVIIKSIENLTEQQSKFKLSVNNLKDREKTLNDTINELEQKAKGIDVEDLKEKLTAAQRVVTQQYLKIKDLEEQIQHAKIQPIIKPSEPQIQIKEAPKMIETTVTVHRSVEIECPTMSKWINIIDCKQKCAYFATCPHYTMFRIVETTEKSTKPIGENHA